MTYPTGAYFLLYLNRLTFRYRYRYNKGVPVERATQTLEGDNMIKATYTSIDRVRISRKFQTLKGAAKFVDKWTGFADYDRFQAVSFDGIGVVRITGATIQQLKDSLTPTPAKQPEREHNDSCNEEQMCSDCEKGFYAMLETEHESEAYAENAWLRHAESGSI